LEDAISNFNKALEISPSLASGYANLGFALDQKGRTEEAVTAYSRALEFLVDRSMAAQVHYKLATLLAKRGDNQTAMLHYRQALKLRPGFVQAQQGLDSVLFKTRED